MKLNKATFSKNWGFSLTDLMIAVALVGVLANLAIPSYRAYKIRTNISEGITAANPIKDEMAYYYTVNGIFPTSDSELGIQADSYATGIVKSISINANGNIVTSFKAIGNQVQEGESIEFQHNLSSSGAIEWVCTPSVTDGVNLQFVPASCRS